jgi:hypothetical protein
MALGSTTALAANEDATTITGVNGATAEFVQESEEKMTVTYESNSLIDGDQYLILMVKGTPNEGVNVSPNMTLNSDQVSYQITESNILYIDQVAAESGKIVFTVYPSSVQDSIILITGASGTLIAAIVDAKYMLGDLTGDGEVDVADAMALLQYVAGIDTSLTETQLKAAELNGVAGIDIADAMVLLQYVAKVIPSLTQYLA